MAEVKILQLFPTLEKGEYAHYSSQTLGGNFVFAFVIQKENRFPETLLIQAIHNGIEKTIPIYHMYKHFYKADVADIGNFYFMVDDSRKMCMYTENEKVKLSVLTPINEEFFEQACKEHHFFFVGG